ncbi:Protein CBG26853 [Caenorhabditis briggsae]|uniref:Protein CBG26853 n=1 Tax=Caenorhabditis briggsae TaxID=6238 RepID=B6IM04_CAEBR|nr:Protein CBG26853 [Caenorhabditis briggsae]CAS00934.1 Protein CBG26853 [Caenorhabditis briggsae]
MASTSSQKTSEDVEDTEEDLKKLVSENKEEEEVGECSSEEGSRKNS